MAEYHVGCGAFYIYAGTLNKDKTKWLNKTEVTDEVTLAAAQYLLEHKEEMKFTYQGERYKLQVVKVEKEE